VPSNNKRNRHYYGGFQFFSVVVRLAGYNFKGKQGIKNRVIRDWQFNDPADMIFEPVCRALRRLAGLY
jgi:hypothetical protein